MRKACPEGLTYVRPESPGQMKIGGVDAVGTLAGRLELVVLRVVDRATAVGLRLLLLLMMVLEVPAADELGTDDALWLEGVVEGTMTLEADSDGIADEMLPGAELILGRALLALGRTDDEGPGTEGLEMGAVVGAPGAEVSALPLG